MRQNPQTRGYRRGGAEALEPAHDVEGDLVGRKAACEGPDGHPGCAEEECAASAVQVCESAEED